MDRQEVLAAYTEPHGEWDVIYDEVNVVGEQYRLESVADFIKGATDAVGRQGPFGVMLKPDPDNAHDPHAVMVVGWWTKPGLFGSKREERTVGYLPSKMAFALTVDRPRSWPYAARLRAFQIDNGEPNILIDVLEVA